MNDDFEGADPRPNLLDIPTFNLATLEFDGWNIHHTTGYKILKIFEKNEPSG